MIQSTICMAVTSSSIDFTLRVDPSVPCFCYIEFKWLVLVDICFLWMTIQVRELFSNGFGMHHAGMLRADRTLTERMFKDGVIKVCVVSFFGGMN